MRSFLQGMLLILLLPFRSYGQVGNEAAQLRVLIGGMVHRPTNMSLLDVRSRHMARHLFLGLTFQRSIGVNYRLGIGAGLSWATHGVRITGQVADSTGTYIVSDETWTRPIWYPFERGFFGQNSVRTDPFQLWVDVVRTLGTKERGPWWELSASLGAASPLGWGYTVPTQVPPISETRGQPAKALTDLGFGWHGMFGLAVERVFQFKNRNRLSAGLEWRYSLDSYFVTELTLWPFSPQAVTIQREPHFMWVGVRMGYIFTWSGTRKPRWVRNMEQRGLPLPAP